MHTSFVELKTFARALRSAIYDKELEESRSIRYYHDADVIVKIVLGFRQYDETKSLSTPKQRMVRALLSSGYLGKAYLLRPHALEIDQQIRGQPAYQTRAAVEAFAARRRQFLVQSDVDEVMETLHAILERPNPQEVKASQFIDCLRTVAPKTWVAIELARGTWKDRLKQLSRYDVIRFDARGLDAGDVLQGEPFRTFHALLREHRIDSSLSNIHDAAALALLHRDIHSQDEGNIVRFYTETKVVAELWDDERVKGLLSYGDGRHEDSTLRDADYFVVRANFDALRFGDLKMADCQPGGQVSVPIDELRRVSDELSKIVEAGDTHFEVAVRQLHIGERPLTETLSELQSLSFVRNVWFLYKPPELLTEPELWSEVWKFSEDMSAASVLDTELEKVRNRLSEEVTQMERWSRNFRDVLSRVGTMKEGWRPQLSPEPLRDLGVIRWGIELESAECERLNRYIVDLMSGDEGLREQASATIAALVESAPPSSSDTVVTVCVLWFLRLFRAVIEVIDEHEKATTAPVMGSLMIIRVAARLHGTSIKDRTHINQLIAEVEKICASAEDDVRKSLLLGGGFVLYYAWLRERDHNRPNERRLRDLATRSFAAGHEAVRLLNDNSLARAFAMNHCAYVGTVTEIDPVRTEEYVSRIIALRGTEFWHYRFADTLAWHHIAIARKEVPDVKKFGLRSKRKRQVCKRLQEAERIYNEDLGDIFGDVEIIGHRTELRSLLLETNC